MLPALPFILSGTISAAVKTFYDIDKSTENEEKALQKYARAFERSGEAELMVMQKKEYAEKRVMNAAKKKRAILQNTMPKFKEVYEKIQKVELGPKAEIHELMVPDSIQKVSRLNGMSISVKSDFTDKELICGILFKGIGGMAVKESERFLSAAGSQMRQANVVYSQAESVVEVFNAIVARADRISSLLASMNALFLKSINETAKTIEKNGYNIRNYSEYEKGVLMTCVDIAAAIFDIIDVPVINENGEIVDAAEEMIITGENYLHKMDELINS